MPRLFATQRKLACPSTRSFPLPRKRERSVGGRRTALLSALVPVCFFLFASLGIAASAHAALAQPEYPNKPLRWIVPFPAGGPADILARIVAERLSEGLRQPIVIDNRAGASGIIGTEVPVRSPADGYTLVWGITSTIATNQFLNKMDYDPAKDLTPVSMVNRGFFVLIVRPTLTTTLREFVDFARSRSGKLTYGSWGQGSGTHLAMELFERRLNAQLVHVPYKGTAPVLNDLMGGHIDTAFETTNPAFQYIRAGKLRAIGVTAPVKKPFFPDVPAIAEVFPGFDVATWGGVLVAAGTPKAIVARLSEEIRKVVRNPVTHTRISDLGTEPVGSTPEEFATRIRQDVELWSKVIKDVGLKPE